MQVYTAASLGGRSRTAAWNDLYATHVERVEFAPADGEGFGATLSLSDLGPVRLARLTGASGSILRGERQIGAAPARVYAFVLQVSGSAVFLHYGHEARLNEGDMVLCDTAAPYTLQLDDEADIVMLRMPAAVLKTHLPSPEYFCGRRLKAAEGATGLVSAVAMSLCTSSQKALQPEFQKRVARHLLDMIATAYAAAFDAALNVSSITSGRHAKVKLFIEQHLRDSDLSPRSVALGLRLSSRYLRMIFASGEETVSAYILRRRLEECARQMADLRWRGHSITEIAFAWGFNSAPHFTRSFRDRYGVSPRAYRRLQLEGQPTAGAA